MAVRLALGACTASDIFGEGVFHEKERNCGQPGNEKAGSQKRLGAVSVFVVAGYIYYSF